MNYSDSGFALTNGLGVVQFDAFGRAIWWSYRGTSEMDKASDDPDWHDAVHEGRVLPFEYYD